MNEYATGRRVGPSWTRAGAPATTKNEIAYGAIRRMILEGELKPETAIDQEELAVSLGLSTTPIREALRRLEAEHLVVVRAHRDTMVAPVSQALLDNVYAIRLTLDPLAAGLAAVCASDAERDHMLSFMDGAPVGASLLETFYFNRHTHRAIYAACGNQQLVNILDQLWDMSDRHRLSVLKSEDTVRRMHEDHVIILRTVVDGDAQLSEKLMREHITHSRSSFFPV